MKISVANILPNPPAQQTTSSSQSAPANASDNTGFSQQLGVAKAKVAQGQGTGNNVQQPQTGAANSTGDTQQAATNSTQDKGKPKQQQQAADQAEAANEAETEAQLPTIDEQEAKLAEEAQNEPPLVHPKITKVISPQLPAAGKGKNAKSDSTQAQGKPANANSNQTADVSPNLTTLQTTAAPQQAAATSAKTDSNDASVDNEEDATAPKQVATKANISPFKAENTTPDASDPAAGQAAADAAADAAQDAGQLAPKEKMISGDPDPSAFAQMFAQTTGQAPAPTMSFQHIVAPQQPQTPVAQFAETNQPAIVSTIHGSLLPDGGTMNINLNPPELGPMQISVKMENGVMSASFQTSSDQATRLLTHTLGQLKDALEIQGVTVDRLHVSQTSSSNSSSNSSSDSENSGKQSQQDGQNNAQQEEQRRETLRRMWRKLRGQEDPLDLVA